MSSHSSAEKIALALRGAMIAHHATQLVTDGGSPIHVKVIISHLKQGVADLEAYAATCGVSSGRRVAG